MSRWTPSIVVVLAVAVACGWIGPPTPVVVIALAVAIGYAWSISPLRSAATKAARTNTAAHRAATHQEAIEVAEDGGVVVYWRPGCGFCARLRYELRSTEPQPVWVDIWSDPEAAAFVREVNNGNETVPTVVIGSGSERTVWTNPPPEQVRLALQEAAGGP